jgi:hypothetical protein
MPDDSFADLGADRAADLIAAYRAGERGDIGALPDIEARDSGAIVVGHLACALSGAIVGFLIGWPL